MSPQAVHPALPMPAQAGLGLVPEGRQMFPTLTVEENLVATAAARFGAPRWGLRDVYHLFPRLAERRENRGRQLSGGEQEMLSIARALLLNPKLLLLDEHSLGLSPVLSAELFAVLARIAREGPASVLLVEQNARRALALASRAYLLSLGKIVGEGDAATLTHDSALDRSYLGL